MSRVVTFATGNANKLREVKQILESSPESAWTLESRALDLPEIQGSTEEVATAKCRSAADQVRGPCLTEDTALGFRALHGLPGPYIKDFLDKLGHAGLNTLLEGFDDNQATALCTFAFCEGPGAEPVLFEGTTEGHIVPARGPTQFGWDPIFQAGEAGKTCVETA
ncbi:adenylate kinase [Malassezia sp. CBS 17886]|nr:adenylate kinase [Malassezia sp. CBS 17886]